MFRQLQLVWLVRRCRHSGRLTHRQRTALTHTCGKACRWYTQNPTERLPLLTGRASHPVAAICHTPSGPPPMACAQWQRPRRTSPAGLRCWWPSLPSSALPRPRRACCSAAYSSRPGTRLPGFIPPCARASPRRWRCGKQQQPLARGEDASPAAGRFGLARLKRSLVLFIACVRACLRACVGYAGLELMCLHAPPLSMPGPRAQP